MLSVSRMFYYISLCVCKEADEEEHRNDLEKIFPNILDVHECVAVHITYGYKNSGTTAPIRFV